MFLILSVWRSDWAIFLLVALLPAYQWRFKIFGLPTTALEMMILIIFLVTLVKNGFKGWRVNLKRWRWLVLVWLIVGLISVAVASDHLGALGYWRAYFLEPILLLLIILDLLAKNRLSKNHIIFALGLSALVCTIWAIAQKWLGGGVMSTEVWGAPKVWRATGPFPQPNFLGLYIGPIAILCFGQFVQYLKNKKWLAIFYGVTFICSVVAAILARSDGTMFGLVVGLIFFGLCWKKSRRLTIIIAVAVILIIFLVPMSRHFVLERLTFQKFSGQLRLNIWQGAWTMIKSHPILGVGLRGYQKLAPQYQEFYYQPQTGQLISTETHPYPHNLFLAVWVELGLLGLLAFLALLIKFFVQGYKITKTNLSTPLITISIMAALVAVLAHGLVDTPYFKNDLAVLFWLIIGLLIT